MAIVVPVRNYYLSRGFIPGYHLALDMAGEVQPVYAAESGAVFAASWDGCAGDNHTNCWAFGGGNTVIIDHNPRFRSVNAHLKSMTVRRGQRVIRGQLIGYLDSTGNSTGNHLHFATRIDGVGDSGWHDPLKYFPGYGLANSPAIRSSLIVNANTNIRKGPSVGYAILRNTGAAPLLVGWPQTNANGPRPPGFSTGTSWNKINHPSFGTGYVWNALTRYP